MEARDRRISPELGGRPAVAFLYRQKYHTKTGELAESSKWYGRYHDHTGKLKSVPLAKDKAAARAMLAALERQAERRRAGISDEFTEAAAGPLAPLVAAFLADLKLRGRTDGYRAEAESLLGRIFVACGFATLADLRAGPLDLYLSAMEGSARTRAKHRQAAVGFAAWLVRKGKLASNPLDSSTRPEGTTTRKRRALTADELRAIVAVAVDRPLREATLIRWGPRTGRHERRLPEEELARLAVAGRNNALLYRTAFYTGLRADELRSLWAGDLVTAGPLPCLHLPGERTKNGDDADLPLPPRLAADLAAWIADRNLGPGDPLFAVPHETAKLLRADLAAAGIPYRDARGRVADFHALRASLASHLNAAGVGITAAKNLMRHSTIVLTADTYHDPALDETRAALARLPDI